MKVLVVEDDARLRATLCAGLAEAGFRVESAAEAPEARLKVAFGSYDVVILDVLLPGGDGLEVCRSMRQEGDPTPVLFLTALGAEDDRLQGFARGGDDYLTKPFSFHELVARVRALARRPPALLPAVERVGDLDVDLSSRRVWRGGSEIELTTQEFTLLEFLARNRDKVMSRAEITAYVWDDNHDPFTNLLEVLVWRLRQKVDGGFEAPLIHTVRGVGYRLGAP